MSFPTVCNPAGVDLSAVFSAKFVDGKLCLNNDPKSRTLFPTTTGTSVLAVKFDGGVAIAADMLGSYGSLARFPGVSRLVKVNETTVLGATGDFADLQNLSEELKLMMIENDIQNDGHQYSPESIFSFLRMLLYHRRNKFDPIWNTLVVAGYNADKPFLGYVDKIGSAYEDDSITTGYGSYMARPLIRKELETNPNLSKVDAVKLLIDCMKILFYRDGRAINKFEIALITKDGVVIESDMNAETNWEIAHMIKGYE